MPEQLTGLRVFIASPGGLDAERGSFRETIEEINRDAAERGVVFIPVGWEYSAPGLGRPQEQINAEIRRCDYLVLVLHDRWGTPPGSDGEFTSGTEEEYSVARECASDANMPMRNIAVLFKGVDARQLSDPGEQLKKVLDFRQRIEEERGLLYKTFDTTSEFERELRALLARWLRDQTEGGAKTVHVPPPNEPPTGPGPEPSQNVGEMVAQADELAKQGRLTQAERLYASAVVGRTDPEAMEHYARFLRRTGRLALSETMSDRLLEMPALSARSKIEALSNKAIIERQRGHHDKSLEYLREATSLAREAGDPQRGDLAFLLDNIGLTLRKQGKFDEALGHHFEAIGLKRDLDDPKSLATSISHTGALLRQQGKLEEARALAEESVRVVSEADAPRLEAQAHANLGEVLSDLGEYDLAKQEFSKALELNTGHKSAQGIGMNLWQLGRIALAQSDLDEASDYAIRALEAAGDERSDRPESTCAPMHLLGETRLAQGRLDEAVGALEYAAEISAANGQTLGAAWAYSDLALAKLGQGDLDGAHRAFAHAASLGEMLGHERFRSHLEDVRQQLISAGDRPDLAA